MPWVVEKPIGLRGVIFTDAEVRRLEEDTPSETVVLTNVVTRQRKTIRKQKKARRNPGPFVKGPWTEDELKLIRQEKSERAMEKRLRSAKRRFRAERAAKRVKAKPNPGIGWLLVGGAAGAGIIWWLLTRKKAPAPVAAPTVKPLFAPTVLPGLVFKPDLLKSGILSSSSVLGTKTSATDQVQTVAPAPAPVTTVRTPVLSVAAPSAQQVSMIGSQCVFGPGGAIVCPAPMPTYAPTAPMLTPRPAVPVQYAPSPVSVPYVSPIPIVKPFQPVAKVAPISGGSGGAFVMQRTPVPVMAPRRSYAGFGSLIGMGASPDGLG